MCRWDGSVAKLVPAAGLRHRRKSSRTTVAAKLQNCPRLGNVGVHAGAAAVPQRPQSCLEAAGGRLRLTHWQRLHRAAALLVRVQPVGSALPALLRCALALLMPCCPQPVAAVHCSEQADMKMGEC